MPLLGKSVAFERRSPAKIGMSHSPENNISHLEPQDVTFRVTFGAHIQRHIGSPLTRKQDVTFTRKQDITFGALGCHIQSQIWSSHSETHWEPIHAKVSRENDWMSHSERCENRMPHSRDVTLTAVTKRSQQSGCDILFVRASFGKEH